MSTVKVKVVRAFCIGGEAQKVGAVVEVSPSVAAELIANGKADRHVAEVAPAQVKPAAAKESKPAVKEPKE